MTDKPDEQLRVVPVVDESRGVPTKCVACDREMQTVVVCDYCHSLNPVAAPTDYFRLLGVPRQFDLNADELRRRYLSLSRHTHPDFFAGDDEEGRGLSLDLASAINDAYRALRDPVARAGYLLELLGGKSSADDKSTPVGFLAEMMELQEQLGEAKADDDAETVAQLSAALNTRRDVLVADLGESFGGFDTRVGCEAMRQDELARIRRTLNAISFVKRILAMT